MLQSFAQVCLNCIIPGIISPSSENGDKRSPHDLLRQLVPVTEFPNQEWLCLDSDPWLNHLGFSKLLQRTQLSLSGRINKLISMLERLSISYTPSKSPLLLLSSRENINPTRHSWCGRSRKFGNNFASRSRTGSRILKPQTKYGYQARTQRPR